MIRTVLCLVPLAACGRVGFDAVADAEVTIGRANYAFVTSALYAGDLGGMTADAVCAQTAIGAGLDGTYVAWTDQGSFDRLSASRGWTRVDGAPIADRPTDFLGSALLAPVVRDELGRDLSATPFYTWTGLRGDGTQDLDCLGWTTSSSASAGLTGDLRAGGTRFTEGVEIPCDQQAHVLCLEIGRVTPVHVATGRGRYAFVSSEIWAPAGRPAADAVCQSEASQASLPGTYLAALPTTTSPTASRFDLAGPRWIRTDGFPLAATANDFFNGGFLDTFANRRAGGEPSPRGLWWAGDPFAMLAASQTCNDWTFGSTGYGPEAGSPDATDHAGVFLAGADYCQNPHHLLCLQQ